MKSLLRIFTSKRFLPIFIAQFGGALNDNLFKSAMLIIVAFQLTDAAAQASTINNVAALLFILPYFLFSTLAGQLADRGDKAVMIQKNKIAEILIVLVGALALYLQSIPLLLFILFCLFILFSLFFLFYSAINCFFTLHNIYIYIILSFSFTFCFFLYFTYFLFHFINFFF